MKKIFFYIILSGLFIVNYSCESAIQKADSDKTSEEVLLLLNEDTSLIPEVIKGISVGIEVWNDPDTIYARISEKDTSKYIWKHTTTVKALYSNVQILEFGTCNYKNGQWVLGNFTKKPFTADEFENWYFIKSNKDIISWEPCKGGYLKKGQEYIDPSNWSVTNRELISRSGLWYFVGVEDGGRKVMGYGRYITMPALDESKD
ncbi:MAG: hypothetical protein ABIJ16_13595 [Bacteroidota bacterium]